MTGASAQQPSPQRPHAPPTAADVMRPALSTVKPDDHVAAAAYLMPHAGATALVVVDDAQPRRPIGLITEADIARAVPERQHVHHVRLRHLMTTDPPPTTAPTTLPHPPQSP